jgi:hypothetical protein
MRGLQGVQWRLLSGATSHLSPPEIPSPPLGQLPPPNFRSPQHGFACFIQSGFGTCLAIRSDLQS